MRPFLFAAVALLVTLTGANGALAADHPKLTDAETFALTIGTGNLSGSPAAVAERLGAYDVVVVDGQEVTRAEVRALRQRGAVVLGYVSVGTIERFRPWYNSAKRYRMELWNDWGEWYARVAAPGYRQLILTRVAPSRPWKQRGVRSVRARWAS